MKYTVCLTQQCNLRCKYCYINKKDSTLSLETADKIIDFIFVNTPNSEKIEFGFFGGEPLLEFNLLKRIMDIIEHHNLFDQNRFQISLVTNGTIFTKEISSYLKLHNIVYCVSCDGPEYVQNTFRCFPDGSGSAELVSQNIKEAISELPIVLVNAVYNPLTIQYLPEVIDYFTDLGIKQIYLSPDITAKWGLSEIDNLPGIFQRIADKYIDFYLTDDPRFISLIDSKIALILRGGYKPLERCRMGRGEYAFAPSGNIYPCERLIGSDNGIDHCIGNINTGLDFSSMICHKAPGQELNSECLTCSLREYCMNWCGCSNFFTSGYYNRVSPFLCFLERTSIEIAFNTYQILENECGPIFTEHLAGIPTMNSFNKVIK